MILTNTQRNKIRKALAVYEDAVNQKHQVLADTEIQSYFTQAFDLTDGYTIENEEIELQAEVLEGKAWELIKERFPLANSENKKLIELLTAMTENIEAYKDVELTQILYNVKLAEKFVALAKRV